MKKTYQKPEAEIIEFLTETIANGQGNTGTVTPSYGYGEMDSDMEL